MPEAPRWPASRENWWDHISGALPVCAKMLGLPDLAKPSYQLVVIPVCAAQEWQMIIIMNSVVPLVDSGAEYRVATCLDSAWTKI
jgi:hypothetical protein